MNTEKKAMKGDEVRVIFHGHNMQDMIYGTIEYTPNATGDSWIIIQGNGVITHLMEFEIIEVLSRKATP